MATIIWSNRARLEYRSCLIYSNNEFGKKAARRFLEVVEKKEKQLMLSPLMGFREPLLEYRTLEYRSCILNKNFKMVYHFNPSNDTVYIDDIWDMRKEPKKLTNRIQ
ncbi:MAG: type II toxin-antitoxin system RelE/ParE family toxin [Prevotella sp.]|nr:type II toxin-antitoxin system RelE/ParE family toxin [Prevotella sp.]